jgi:hypothetical protein
VNAALANQITDAVVQRISNLDVGILNVESQLFPDATGLDDTVGAEEILLVSVCDNFGVDQRMLLDSAGMQHRFMKGVYLVDPIGAEDDVHAKKATYMRIRKAVMDAFELPKSGKFQLAGVLEVNGCEFIQQIAFDPNLPNYQHVRLAFGLRFRAYEARPV